MALYYLHIFVIFQNFTTIFSHSSITKMYGVPQSGRGGSSPRRRHHLFTPPPPTPPPQLMFTLYYWGKKLSGGGRIFIRQRNKYMRWQNNYKGASADGWRQNNHPGRSQVDQKFKRKISQCRKLSHTAENTLVHCETYPYTLHYLNTLPSYLNTNLS